MIWWIIIALAVLVLAYNSRKSSGKTRRPMSLDDKRALKHTIRVNLSILENELIELKQEVEALGDIPEQEEITFKIQFAEKVVNDVSSILNHVEADEEISKMLKSVFAAMNGTSEVRRAVIQNKAKMDSGSKV